MSWIVAWDRSGLLVANGSASLIASDLEVDPQRVAEQLSVDPSEYSLSSVLGRSQGALLRDRLSDIGFPFEALHSRLLPAPLEKLATLVAHVAAGREPLVGLWRAGDEALWLPPTDLQTQKRALRMFLSGFENECWLRAYSGLLLNQGGVVVETVDETLTVPDDISSRKMPAAVDLANGGILDQFALDDTVGRMHSVQHIQQTQFRHTAIVLSEARYALPNLSTASDQDGPTISGGAALCASSSRVRAIGEAVERFAGGDVRRSQILRARTSELDAEWLHPQDVSAWTAVQCKALGMECFDVDAVMSWVLGFRAISGEDVWVPAQLVWYPFSEPGRRYHYTRSNSSGMAAGPDLHTAARWAFLELIERDRFMRAWLGRESLPRIRLSTLAGPNQRIARVAKELGWDLHLVDLSSPQTAVILAVCRRNGVLALGSAAGERAIEAATLEALISAECSGYVEPVPDEDVRSPRDHRSTVLDPARAERAEFLIDGPTYRSADELPEGGSDPTQHTIIVDLSSHFTFPYAVARVLCPGVIPITFGYGAEPLGLSEAQHLAQSGWDGAPPPHPFP